MQDKIIIKTQGHLDKKWEDWFDGMNIIYERNMNLTIFHGGKKDDAFIHGILNKIRDLNLKLISVYTSQEN